MSVIVNNAVKCDQVMRIEREQKQNTDEVFFFHGYRAELVKCEKFKMNTGKNKIICYGNRIHMT